MSETKSKRAGVVCGTDFSASARAAGEAAAALAHAAGKPLLLVHAAAHGTEGRMPREVRRAMLTRLRAALREEAARLRELGATVRIELAEGSADEELARCARASGARLVVVGSLGVRDAGAWLVGSVAERTAASSPVPTLVVRSPEPFTAWLRGERPLRLFVGFDSTLTAEAALEWVAELRRLGPCELTAGHASWAAEESERFGVRRRTALETPPTIQRALEREVRERVALLLGDEEAATVVVRSGWGRADLQLVEMAAEVEADLVVVGTHQRRGLPRLWQGSVSRGVLENAPISVACVPLTASRRRLPPAPEIRRVLVATDFSVHGNYALALAGALPPAGGIVRAVHVADPRAIADGESSRELGETPRHLRYLRGLRGKLEQLLPLEAETRGVTVEARLIRDRDVAGGICQEAERFGADVVVVGSLGLTGLARLALGSVAQAVLKRSRRPVVVVRMPEI
jgi:nucleotide-binding universal stress UspA family protein